MTTNFKKTIGAIGWTSIAISGLISMAVAPACNAQAIGVWSGTTTGPTSGIRYAWRLESKDDHVDVQASGQLNGETYPIECDPGRIVRGQEFAATCHYLKETKGIVANTTFELRGELSGEAPDLTYKSGSFVTHFTLHKEQTTAQAPAAGAAMTEPPNKTTPEAARPTPPASATPANRAQQNVPEVASLETMQKWKRQIGNTAIIYPPATKRYREELERIGNSGNAIALNELGRLYFQGTGVPRNDQLAGQLFEKAARLGEPSAMANLAAWYLAKRNQYDPSLALPWAQKSANAGNLSGAHILGAMYEGGLGVTKNFDEAKRWYEKAGQEAVPELNRLENAKRQAMEEQKQASERQAQLAAQEQQRIEYARSAKEGSEREAAAQAAAQTEATKRLRRWQEYQAREKTLIEKVLNYSSTALEEGTAEDYWIIDQNDKCSAVRQYPVGELVVNIRKFNIRGFRYSQEFFGDETQRFMTFSRDQRMERLEKAWALAFQECPGKKSDF